jgi:acetyl/propionyl-CoA carboxylase alpha subunit
VTVEPKNKRECRVRVKNRIIDCVCDRPEEISTWAIRHEGLRIHARARSIGSNKVEVWLGGLPFLFTVTPMGTQDVEPARTAIPKSGEIQAIMPGRITSILVKAGEEVSVGTPLVILEAMKMQNEIVSHKSGHVTSIKVQEGDTVRKDDVLIQIR